MQCVFKRWLNLAHMDNEHYNKTTIEQSECLWVMVRRLVEMICGKGGL